MKLSADQDRAIKRIEKWQDNGEVDPFILAGYAGTGKTTLTQEFINRQNDPVMCLAPTGKAASVLQRKLKNARVTTVHKALYTPVSPSTAQLDFLEAYVINNPDAPDLDIVKQQIADEKYRLSRKDLKFNLKNDCLISPGQLVVVDESSMVTRQMFRDLMKTNAKVLFVGDPGQLPPVNDHGFFTENPPDVVLETVHRQALDSPIIRASLRVRNGQEVEETGDAPAPFRKIPKQALPGKEWIPYDQVVTGTNESRRKVNRYFRRQLGRNKWWPVIGDKLICLKNANEGSTNYINGVQAISTSDAEYNDDFGEVMGDIMYEGLPVTGVNFYHYPFQAHYDLDGEGRIRAVEEPWQSRQGLKEFDYAYAITVHKSQGSEWDRVLLADDGINAGGQDFRKRWLYTAITRARQELTWLF